MLKTIFSNSWNQIQMNNEHVFCFLIDKIKNGFCPFVQLKSLHSMKNCSTEFFFTIFNILIKTIVSSLPFEELSI